MDKGNKEVTAPRPIPVARIGRSLLSAGVLWLILIVAGHLKGAFSFHAWGVQVGAIVGVALLGTLVWKTHPILRRWFITTTTGIAVMVVLLIATVCGTVIVQGLSKNEFVAKYGESTAGFFQMLFLNDIFHSLPFRSFLAILAVSLILITFQRKVWRFSEWGFLLSHTGVVIILIGGLIGSLYGMKGTVDLHAGQTAQAVTLQMNDEECEHDSQECGPDHKDCNMNMSKTIPLGFGLRLDKFEIERHPLEYRFYVYEAAGHDYRTVSSHALKGAGEWTPVGKSGQSFRLVKTYPDFVLQTEIKEALGNAGQPMIQLRVHERDGRSKLVTLVAGSADRDTLTLGQGRTRIQFFWEPGNQTLVSSESIPERHMIEFRTSERTAAESLPIKEGGIYPLSGGEYELTVLRYIPDFAYDTERREGYSRSAQPNNPAVKVSLRELKTGLAEERWLFAKMPDYGQAHGSGNVGPRLVYQYVPPREPAEREIVIVGKTREVMDCRRGASVERRALAASSKEPLAPQMDVTCERLLDRGEELTKPLSRSSEWRHPAAEVEVMTAGQITREFLPAGENQYLTMADEKTILAFDRKADDIKSFQSRVSILNDKGEKLLQTTLAVNDPLSFGGYSFYQSNYRKEDPTYSGFLVVKDPGLPLVYAGFIMACLGVIFILYVRPVILKRRLAATKKGELCLRLPRSLVHTAWF